MTGKKLITLAAWLEAMYAEGSRPTIHTARRWIRDGHIWPLPEKQGRTYYLSPTAEYVTERQRVPHAA